MEMQLLKPEDRSSQGTARQKRRRCRIFALPVCLNCVAVVEEFQDRRDIVSQANRAAGEMSSLLSFTRR
jgi:hypothetical protein